MFKHEDSYDHARTVALKEINAKLNEAAKAYREATQIAEKHGVAFEAYGPSGTEGNWYLPKSFKEMWGDPELVKWLADDPDYVNLEYPG